MCASALCLCCTFILNGRHDICFLFVSVISVKRCLFASQAHRYKVLAYDFSAYGNVGRDRDRETREEERGISTVQRWHDLITIICVYSADVHHLIHTHTLHFGITMLEFITITFCDYTTNISYSRPHKFHAISVFYGTIWHGISALSLYSWTSASVPVCRERETAANNNDNNNNSGVGKHTCTPAHTRLTHRCRTTTWALRAASVSTSTLI